MRILFFIHGLYGGGAEHVASILLNHISCLFLLRKQKPFCFFFFNI